MKKYLEFKFYKGNTPFDLRYCKGDDEYRDCLMFGLFGWNLMIILKFVSLNYTPTDDDSNQYGVYLHTDNRLSDATLWLWWGRKHKVIEFPWNLKWYKTSILLKSGDWFHETKGQRKNFYDKGWKDQQYCLNYIYNYKLITGEIQTVPTKVYVEKREWRRKGWMWCSLFNMVNKTIDIDFSKEVGEGVGSYKGGTIGCSYRMKKNEDAMQAIMRMERERRFNR